MKTVTAAEANRQFSRVLREISQGETFTVLSRGTPVATIAPARAGEVAQRAAKSTLLTRLRGQPASGERDWAREELYEG